MPFWRREKSNIVVVPFPEESSASSEEPETAGSHPIYDNVRLSTPNAIRLLDLQPGSRGDVVECKLRSVDLLSQPLYTAISYTWGDEGRRWTIKIDGHEFDVRENLEDILRDLRNLTQSRTFWIDAICIDQENIPERNAQLKIMGNIFRSATQVIAWLNDYADSYGHRPSRGLQQIKAYTRGEVTISEVKKDLWLRLNSLNLFFEHAYWSRRWIIQEIGLARTVTVVCGKEQLPLSALPHFVRFPFDAHSELKSDGSQPFAHFSNSSALQLHDLQQQQAQKPGSANLSELLERYCDSGCHERLDTIYALLSLSDEARRHVLVDYASPLIDVLASVLKFAVSEESLEPSRTLKFVRSLTRQMRLTSSDLLEEIQSRQPSGPETSTLLLEILWLGKTTSLPVPAHHHHIIEDYRTELPTMRHYRPRPLSGADPKIVLAGMISPQDLCAFIWQPSPRANSLIDVSKSYYGLATCPVRDGDFICQIAFRETAVVYRLPEDSDSATVIGRALLFDIGFDSIVQTHAAPEYRYFMVPDAQLTESSPLPATSTDLALTDVRFEACQIIPLLLLSGDEN